MSLLQCVWKESYSFVYVSQLGSHSYFNFRVEAILRKTVFFFSLENFTAFLTLQLLLTFARWFNGELISTITDNTAEVNLGHENHRIQKAFLCWQVMGQCTGSSFWKQGRTWLSRWLCTESSPTPTRNCSKSSPLFCILPE